MKKLSLITLVLLLLLQLRVAVAQPSLRFVAEDLYPLHYITEQGKYAGFLVELAQLLTEECEINSNIEIMPQARAFKEFRNDPNTIMLSLLKTPSRENDFQFLGEVYQAKAYLIGLKQNHIKLKTLRDAQKFRTGTVRGYFSQVFLESKGFSKEDNLVLATDPASLLNMLYKDRTDLVLTNSISLEQELTLLKLEPESVEHKLELADFPNELHFTAHSQLSKSTVIRLSKALQKIKQDGRYFNLATKWQVAY